MSSLKDIKLAQKSLQLQQQLINEFESLVQDIERCEKTVGVRQNCGNRERRVCSGCDFEAQIVLGGVSRSPRLAEDVQPIAQ